MPKTRKELQEQFAAEIYLSASFFKMKRVSAGDKFTPLKECDALIQQRSGAIAPMADPRVTTKFIAQREPMPKIKPVRGVAQTVFGPIKGDKK